MVFPFGGQNACIAVEHAPAELRAFLEWTNRQLDELEFGELINTLADLGGLGGRPPHAKRDPPR